MQRDLDQEMLFRDHQSPFEATDVVSTGMMHVPGTEQLGKVAQTPLPVVSLKYIDAQWATDFTTSSTRRLSWQYLCWRRAMDIVFGLLGMVLLLLLLPILALLIYLDSPGSIFYTQERLGYRGQAFSMLKFRSMCTDAETAGNAVWAAEHDERVTRIGRFMRAIHLDELPQVYNILRGEMSLIGPRPERAVFVTALEKTVPLYRHRLEVKPGLTGWAQVNYHYARSEEDAFIKLQYDLHYIAHKSLKLDLLILLKTVGEVLAHHGA